MPTTYRPSVCTRSRFNDLGPPCAFVSFADLLERQLWRLILLPLQAAICEPPAQSSSQQQANASGVAFPCTGAYSRAGDRIRLAGAAGGAAEEGPSGGSMLLYIDAIPTRQTGADQLQADLSTLLTRARGVSFNATDVVEADRRWPAGGVPWYLDGLRQLRSNPADFDIKGDGLFTSFTWLPNMSLDTTGPYIINRRAVPDWTLIAVAAASDNGYGQAVALLQAIEDAALRALCGSLSGAWALLLAMRCFGWQLLFGRGRRWLPLHTFRGVNLVGVFTDFMEAGVLLLLFSAEMWLLPAGVLDSVATGLLTRLHLGLLLLVIAAAVILPSFGMVVQLLAAGMAPRRCRCCGCRVRRRLWRRLLAGALGWHGAAALLATLLSVLRLAGSSSASAALSAQTGAASACLSQKAATCDSGRQLLPFDVDVRRLCAQDCSVLAKPAADAMAAFERLAFRLALAAGIFSMMARSTQLAVALGISDSALQAALPSKPASQGKGVAKTQTGDREGDVVSEGDAEEAAEEAPRAEIAVLTPEAFAAGVRAAEEKQRRERERPVAVQGGPVPGDAPPAPLAPGTRAAALLEELNSAPLTPSGNEGMRRIMAALAAVEGLADPTATNAPALSAKADGGSSSRGAPVAAGPPAIVRPPTPTGGGGVALGATGSLLAGLVVDGEERELLAFAQQVARQCSRDSFVSRESGAEDGDRSASKAAVDRDLFPLRPPSSKSRAARARPPAGDGQDSARTPNGGGSARSSASGGSSGRRFVADW